MKNSSLGCMGVSAIALLAILLLGLFAPLTQPPETGEIITTEQVFSVDEAAAFSLEETLVFSLDFVASPYQDPIAGFEQTADPWAGSQMTLLIEKPLWNTPSYDRLE